MPELAALESFAAELIAGLQPAERKQLATDIARQLLASQQKRIAAQLNPDGSGFIPRKSQLRQRKGKLRAQMFTKLRTAKYLKAKGTADEAIVAFTADVSRIARVHQFGLHDRVNKKTGLEVVYPERQLLGFSAADIDLIRDLTALHLGNRL
jgi:phage virion morphogenesis protein